MLPQTGQSDDGENRLRFAYYVLAVAVVLAYCQEGNCLRRAPGYYIETGIRHYRPPTTVLRFHAHGNGVVILKSEIARSFGV